MIGSLGVPELLFILVLALLVFGPRKLPEIGRTLGRALGEFKRATSDLKRTLDVELTSEDFNPTAVKPTPGKTEPRKLDPVPAPPVETETPGSPADEQRSAAADDQKEEAS